MKVIFVWVLWIRRLFKKVESSCAWSCIFFSRYRSGIPWCLLLISSITSIWSCDLLSKRSSKRYNCCIALSKVDFPVHTFAALVTPSLPTMPMVQWFLLHSCPSIITIDLGRLQLTMVEVLFLALHIMFFT